jgi:hypothetical protein
VARQAPLSRSHTRRLLSSDAEKLVRLGSSIMLAKEGKGTPRVRIVEDAELLRRPLAGLLKRKGFAVVDAADAIGGWNCSTYWAMPL